MKAYELMVGDFVIVNGILRQVSQITKHKIGYHRTEQPFGECKMSYSRLYEIKPVPLTSEILEKNGFAKIGNNYEFWFADGDEYFTIHFDNGMLWLYVANTGPVIEYVHQLQHALRLCGLRELADNFKV